MTTTRENTTKRKNLVFCIQVIFHLRRNKKSKLRGWLRKLRSSRSVLIRFRRSLLERSPKKIRKTRNQNLNPNPNPNQKLRLLMTMFLRKEVMETKRILEHRFKKLLIMLRKRLRSRLKNKPVNLHQMCKLKQ